MQHCNAKTVDSFTAEIRREQTQRDRMTFLAAKQLTDAKESSGNGRTCDAENDEGDSVVTYDAQLLSAER